MPRTWRSLQNMAIAIVLQLICTWFVVAVYRVSALPVPQAISEQESWMRSALLTLRDLANNGLPSMDFYAACQAIDTAEGLTHTQTNQSCGHNCNNGEDSQTAAQLILVAQHVKTALCNLVQQMSDSELISGGGSCSDKAIELFCTKVKITHQADTAQKLLNKARIFQCSWFEETIGKDRNVPQHVKDSIREKIACPAPPA